MGLREHMWQTRKWRQHHQRCSCKPHLSLKSVSNWAPFHLFPHIYALSASSCSCSTCSCNRSLCWWSVWGDSTCMTKLMDSLLFAIVIFTRHGCKRRTLSSSTWWKSLWLKVMKTTYMFEVSWRRNKS